MSKKVVYNNKPDPVISIKEYKTDKNGELVLVEEFKPIPSDSYKLETDKSLFIIEVKKNTYEEALKSDPLLLAEQRMLLNQQMEDN